MLKFKFSAKINRFVIVFEVSSHSLSFASFLFLLDFFHLILFLIVNLFALNLGSSSRIKVVIKASKNDQNSDSEEHCGIEE